VSPGLAGSCGGPADQRQRIHDPFLSRHGVFGLEANQCFYFCAGTIPNLARDVFRQGKLHEGTAMPQRNALNLDSSHNTAIRTEIAERLRVLLSKDQPSPPPRVQHLLDCINPPDAARGQSGNRRR
jgi:hypothetical protein